MMLTISLSLAQIGQIVLTISLPLTIVKLPLTIVSLPLAKIGQIVLTIDMTLAQIGSGCVCVRRQLIGTVDNWAPLLRCLKSGFGPKLPERPQRHRKR